jgi:hypothetical protein
MASGVLLGACSKSESGRSVPLEDYKECQRDNAKLRQTIDNLKAEIDNLKAERGYLIISRSKALMGLAILCVLAMVLYFVGWAMGVKVKRDIIGYGEEPLANGDHGASRGGRGDQGSGEA